MADVLHWRFPLPRPYTGVFLANGVLGAMVWGEGCELRVSLARNGFWDRRGGVPFASAINYRQLRTWLEAGKLEEVRAAFVARQTSGGGAKPTQLPGARLEIETPGPLREARLNLQTGWLEIPMESSSPLRMRICPDAHRLEVEGPFLRACLRPAWEWISPELAATGVPPPQLWQSESGGGFRQNLPHDPHLEMVWEKTPRGLVVDDRSPCAARHLPGSGTWWETALARRPRLDIPDPALQRAWDYGWWKLACLTPPHAPAATLQGPWMAETELPPWSNDYHFNINLEMIYGPCLATGLFNHFEPVWRLLASWMPQLQQNGRAFFENSRALMLPHAVDDRCQVIGSYWQGTIDQACAAWMGLLAWQHYRHTLDLYLLRETAWPLLQGAFEGFWAMVEEAPDGTLRLPVSVSAEFPGWGANSSFQLAALHMTCRLLREAAQALSEPQDPRWLHVQEKLPTASTMRIAKVWGEKELRDRIVLWEGQDLTESHRHHSHLAAIYPFSTLDPAAHPVTRELIKRSLEHWVRMGCGQWAGWSFPWAASIWARCGHGSPAATLLHLWQETFTNSGGATLHDADFPGITTLQHGPFLDEPGAARTRDVMQLDAGCGALQALAELCVQQRGQQLWVAPCHPKQWPDYAFEGLHAEGGFLVSAEIHSHVLQKVRIYSTLGGTLRIGFPTPMRPNGGAPSPQHALETSPGSEIVFEAVG